MPNLEPIKTFSEDSFDMVFEEMIRQKEKHGNQHHTMHEWLTILVEEVGEVAKDINDRADKSKLRSEVVQVAAVAHQMIRRLI